MSLMDKNTNINGYAVKWMHPLDLTDKSNLYDNPTWDEAMNVPHK